LSGRAFILHVMADISILDQSVHAAPKGYTVKGAQEIRIKSVTGSFDGTGAGGSWIPAVQIVDPSGFVVLTAVADSTLAAGASADVSWFPGVAPSGSGGIAGVTWEHNDALVAVEPGGDFEDSSSVAWTVTDDAANTRAKIAATVLTFPSSILHPALVNSEHGWAEFANAGDVLPKGAASRTFEVWAKLNGDPGAHDLYFYMHGPNSVAGDSFGLLHNGNVAFAPNMAFNYGGANSNFTQYIEWNDTNWHHFVVAYDGNVTLQMYLDAQASPTLTLPQVENVAATQPLIIGNFQASGSLGTALLAEMAVYSGQLSSSRVSAHYAARFNGQYSAAVLADAPIVYYRFADAGVGLTMADSSGNGHNGTYSGQFTPNSAANNFCYLVVQGAVV
jgi:hypothetical protein